MRNLDFATKLCKPRHPFTKGKVERLVRFVKENFLVGRAVWNVTDLNRQALEWCNRQNGIFHRAIGGVPHEMHTRLCAERARTLEDNGMVREYLCPMRRISFDGFVNYEGRRFGVPYSYTGNVARVMRQDGMLYIYSEDLSRMLATHEVTWSRHDSFCEDQYAAPDQPEEHPSVPVAARIRMIQPPAPVDSFEKFISVFLEGQTKPYVLRIAGSFTEAPESLLADFPARSGSLGFYSLPVVVGEVYSGTLTEDSFWVANFSNKAAAVSFKDTPSGMKITPEVQTIRPMERARFNYAIEVDKKCWGRKLYKAVPVVNGAKSAPVYFSLTATEDFTSLSREERESGPLPGC